MEAGEECFLHEYLEEQSPASLLNEKLRSGLTLVILGTYNGKPPSLGKGGFPFSSISCARCHAPPLGNQRQENEALALGPSAMSGLFATTPSAVAAALCNFAIRCDCPAMLDVLALKPYAMLGLSLRMA